jgi:hypothetical protein
MSTVQEIGATMRQLGLLLAAIMLLILGALTGTAKADEDAGATSINMCEELDISPCPAALESVLATASDVIPLDNNCDGIVTSFGPTSAFQPSPLGTYVIRAFVMSIQVNCRKARDLSAFAENVPATNGNGAPFLQVTPCVGQTSCIASAGWARHDLFGIAPPICYVASVSATADGRTFGPFFAPGSTAGFGCMPG